MGAIRLKMNSARKNEPKRVVIYKVGSLGDTVAALPCFNLIAREFPDAERVLLTNLPLQAKVAAAETVLENSGLIHRTIRYAMKRGGIWRSTWDLLRFRPDMVVYLRELRPIEEVRRDRLFFRYVCRSKRLVGFPSFYEGRRLMNANTRYYESEAFRQARMIGEIGDAAPEKIENWNLHLTDAEIETSRKAIAELKGAPFLACAPGTAMPAKDWGKERWQSLMERLSKDFLGHGLVFIGAKQDAETADFAGTLWRGPALNLCGKTTVRITAGVLGFARLFLGGDSGPMHLAASVGTPAAIAFASREQRGIWFPQGAYHEVLYREMECSMCRLIVCREHQNRCLTAISVQDMREASHRAIQKKAEMLLSIGSSAGRMEEGS
jgi:heptosyltransferase III